MSKIDLTPFFMNLSGQKYLKVAGRMLMFREQHPAGGIHTELVQLDLDRGFALYKAMVLAGDNTILATAYGSETLKGFPTGWVEKAETVAVGRALAAAGFGTQFALADFYEGDGEAKLSDAPVPTSAPDEPAKAKRQASSAITYDKPSQEQLKRLWALVKAAGLTPDWLRGKMEQLKFPASTSELSIGEYQTLIALLEGKAR
jgi:hypothetical protein